MDTSATTSSVPSDLFSEAGSAYQKTYRPVGSVIQFNQNFSPVLMVGAELYVIKGHETDESPVWKGPGAFNSNGNLVLEFGGNGAGDYKLHFKLFRS